MIPGDKSYYPGTDVLIEMDVVMDAQEIHQLRAVTAASTAHDFVAQNEAITRGAGKAAGRMQRDIGLRVYQEAEEEIEVPRM